MKILKQSTTATVTIGPVLDANGAAVTTAVVGDFRISKNGTPATLSGATVTHDANGYYTIALTTSNTDTVGRLEIYSGNTAQATAVHNWLVLLASVFDAIQTNATNSTGGLVTATGSVTALAGAISTLTAAGVRTELATELGRIDTTVSSRLATSGYTAPPSASTNATAVRTELTTELNRIDATISSRLAASSYTAPPTAGTIADAVWDEAYSGHTTAGTFGKLMDTLRKANNISEGTILATPTPTTTVFRISGADYPTGALEHSVLWMGTGASENQNSSILTTLNNGDGTVTVTLEEALVTAPSAGDTVLIDPTSHVHAIADIQAGLATSGAVAAVQADVTTLLSRITATLFSGITYLSRWLGALAGKTADAATQTEIRATTAGATYTITTDSLEAIRDNSGGGGGSGDASQTTLLEVQGTVNGIAASLSGTTVSVSSRVSAAGEITLWAGDDCRVRSGTEIEVTITDVGGSIYTRLNGIGIANLAWGAARIVQPAGAITGTIAALTQAGSGASQTLTISIEITDGGSDLRAADDYTWQIVSSEQHGTEYDQQVELEGSLVLRRRVAVPVY